MVVKQLDTGSWFPDLMDVMHQGLARTGDKNTIRIVDPAWIFSLPNSEAGRLCASVRHASDTLTRLTLSAGDRIDLVNIHDEPWNGALLHQW